MEHLPTNLRYPKCMQAANRRPKLRNTKSSELDTSHATPLVACAVPVSFTLHRALTTNSSPTAWCSTHRHHEHNLASSANKTSIRPKTLLRHPRGHNRRSRCQCPSCLLGILLLHAQHQIRPLRHLIARPHHQRLPRAQPPRKPTGVHRSCHKRGSVWQAA